jgi:hypothetical protein
MSVPWCHGGLGSRQGWRPVGPAVRYRLSGEEGHPGYTYDTLGRTTAIPATDTAVAHRAIGQTFLALGQVAGHPPVRALPGDTQLPWLRA